MEDLDKQIMKLAGGDMDALETLYERTKTAVYGFALSIVRHPQDAEDVMQDTYIRVVQGSGRYHSKGKPMAWILTIVRNLALDKLRTSPDAELPFEDEWVSDSKADFTEAALDRMVLRTVLKELTEEERQIVILRSIEGLKHREIAKLLAIPLGTALSKYHRSLSKLRTILEEEGK
ncbi:MAG TPA: RNA polymerase sigma factor [Bacillota bacterium]|nr:RNA polymerase sigma factor [Fastidiosipila sp.]HPX92580.1 RNA polymerase sigma factor [Bacillota bacterium]HQB81152.1 RNA polymerase sigma factor [Bacillota bacterium]